MSIVEHSVVYDAAHYLLVSVDLPLVGHVLEQLGYDRTYSLRPTGAVATVPRWEDAVSWDGRVSRAGARGRRAAG